MGRNLVEKITQRFAVRDPDEPPVRSGDVVRIRPAHVLTHDNTGAILPKFHGLGVPRVRNAAQPVIVLDHDIQNRSAENLAKYETIRDFAQANSLAFFAAGHGIGHQVLVEEGFVRPGTFVVGADSHSNLYGALAAVGTPVVRTDAAVIWATGETWWEVPPVVRVELTGALSDGVTGKDVILSLLGTFRNGEVRNCAVEFTGRGVAALSMDQRMTIANMTTEWSALAGVFPHDETTQEYLRARVAWFTAREDRNPRLTEADLATLWAERMAPDPDAVYAAELTLDLSRVVPYVAGPNEVDVITSLPEIESRRIRVDKAYLVSCVNSRLEDLVAAARVVKGRTVAGGVELYLAAASAAIEEEARRVGAWDDLLAAGAIPLPPGCGPCIGLGAGTLQPGEVGISATNRNFRGRMGSRDAECYLASPVVVAASALAGRIVGPASVRSGRVEAPAAPRPSFAPPPAERTVPLARPSSAPRELVDGFPRRMTGELVWLPKDNLNTDGIYGKDVTYRDGLSPDEMATHVFGNYDPDFRSVARAGDVIVSGDNFGCGSSREQAVTALQAFGIPGVIAASFSQVYKRNAYNNGFVLLESPDLTAFLRARFDAPPPTVRTGLIAEIDFSDWVVRAGHREFELRPVPALAQRLIAAGGVEALVRDGKEAW